MLEQGRQAARHQRLLRALRAPSPPGLRAPSERSTATADRDHVAEGESWPMTGHAAPREANGDESETAAAAEAGGTGPGEWGHFAEEDEERERPPFHVDFRADGDAQADAEGGKAAAATATSAAHEGPAAGIAWPLEEEGAGAADLLGSSSLAAQLPKVENSHDEGGEDGGDGAQPLAEPQGPLSAGDGGPSEGSREALITAAEAPSPGEGGTTNGSARSQADEHDDGL